MSDRRADTTESLRQLLDGACSAECMGSGTRVTRVLSVSAPSGGWVVLSEGAWSNVERVAAKGALRPAARHLVAAARRLLDAKLADGAGPVAPTFDAGDRAYEMKRGRWVVVDEDEWRHFHGVVRPD